MKKAILNFPSKPVSYAPRFVSRRFAMRGDRTASRTEAYKEEGDDAAAKEALLLKIKSDVEAILQARGYQKKEEVSGIVTSALEGLNLDALRAYGTDKTAFETQIRNLALKVEKVEKAGVNEKRSKTQAIKDLLEKRWKDIENLMTRKGKSGPNEIVLNMRAAATMTMDAAIEEPVDLPDDLIESFSVDTFVKKRRPVEYIWEMVSRSTIAGITEYKTWLSEGGEEGAFAIVAEGAVKPLMSKSLVRNFTKYRKMAGKRVYTEEFPKFRKEAYSIIESLFNDQIMRNYNAVITTSLMTKAASYVGTALDGQYDNPTDYHAIGAVAAQEESLEFYPDLLILNPQDKWRIGLSQDQQGSFYVSIPTYNPSGTVTMMGFRVFTSNKMEVGQAILGESGLYKIEDEPIQIRLAYGINVVTDVNGFVTSVTSDVDNNRFRIIAETFFHDYIDSNHVGSFVKFNFADVKAALKKVAV